MGQLQLPLHVNPHNFEPVHALTEAARGYARGVGQDFDESAVFASVYSPRQRANGMAAAHAWTQGSQEAPTPETLGSYDAMIAQTQRQFDWLTAPRSKGGGGIDVNVTAHDPYASPDDLRHDVAENGRMNVFATATTGGHPLLTDDQNDMFRAVHDAYGHLALGRDFSRHGEEAAFRAHRSMYTPEAHAALASETRGQNSRMVFAHDMGQSPGFDNVPSNVPGWMTQSDPTPPKHSRLAAPLSPQPTLFG